LEERLRDWENWDGVALTGGDLIAHRSHFGTIARRQPGCRQEHRKNANPDRAVCVILTRGRFGKQVQDPEIPPAGRDDTHLSRETIAKGRDERQDQEVGLIRTALFVPANRPDRVEKALASAADAVIIDLEDSVPPSEKPSSRATIARNASGCERRNIWVRVNALDTEWFEDDIRAAIVPSVSSIVLPKPGTPDDVEQVAALIDDCEKGIDRTGCSVGLVAFIESAMALENVYRIACSATGRLTALAFGAADYTLDMGIDMTCDGDELMYARSRIAVASRAAGIARPIDTPYMVDIHDLDGLRVDSMRAKGCGCGGKLCIHPKQVEVVNEVFSPSRAEIERAAKAVSAFEEAQSLGRGAVAVDGLMVDYPVYYRLKDILLAAGKTDQQLQEG